MVHDKRIYYTYIKCLLPIGIAKSIYTQNEEPNVCAYCLRVYSNVNTHQRSINVSEIYSHFYCFVASILLCRYYLWKRNKWMFMCSDRCTSLLLVSTSASVVLKTDTLIADQEMNKNAMAEIHTLNWYRCVQMKDIQMLPGTYEIIKMCLVNRKSQVINLCESERMENETGRERQIEDKFQSIFIAIEHVYGCACAYMRYE